MSDDWIDDLNNKLTGAEYECDGMIGHDQDGYFIPDRPAQGSGDWRIDRIDQIIQDTYDEAIWWHNKRIETEGNPEGNPSGLRGIKNKLPELPDTGGYGTSLERNGYPQANASVLPQSKRGGLSCAEIGLIAAVVIGLVIFMMVMS